jgi:hypothetical protein
MSDIFCTTQIAWVRLPAKEQVAETTGGLQRIAFANAWPSNESSCRAVEGEEA